MRAPERDQASDLHERPSRVQAVLLDFYGTLARATRWVSVDEVLAERGYDLDPAVRDRWWNDGIDGIEHVEHSRSRDHYLAWQQERMLGMLADADVHPGEYQVIVEALRARITERVLEPYPEVADVLTELRERGLKLAICSNWDWDLAEAVAEVGLTDAFDTIVSSAWVGARKPHHRIFHHTLESVGAAAGEARFVGDTWVPDVEGPRAAGITPVYLRRTGHWPDPGAPADLDESPPAGVHLARDLTALAELV